MGGLFMGIIGCGHTFSTETLQALENAICIVGSVDNFNVGMYCSSLCGASVILKMQSTVCKLAFVAGIVVGVNYMSLVSKIKDKRRKK